MHNPNYPSGGHSGAPTPESRLAGIDRLIAGIPTDRHQDVDAVVAFPGIVLDRAVQHAANDWNTGIGDYFLVAGYHEPEVAEKLFGPEKLAETYGLVYRDDLHSQVHALHASEQARWVAEKVKDLGITSLGLYVPNFHLPRVFLTTLESMRRLGVPAVMIPMPTPMSPFEPCVLDASEKSFDKRDLSQMDVLYPEFDPRIKSYQQPKADSKPGDVATDEVFMEYLRWLYEQPIIRNALI